MLSRIIYPNYSNDDLFRASVSASFAFENPAFLSVLSTIGEFDYSFTGKRKVTGADLVNVITSTEAGKTGASVKLWRPWNPWTRATAYTDGTKSIYINSRKIYRYSPGSKKNIASLAGTLAHEYVHVLDAFHSWNFDHGDNYSDGKEKSAPYLVGNEMERFVLAQ